ncbi:angiopoietin-2 isoform X5 [Drosophila biarmipes]|nr:angiopoietin-2 isoform X5 [Drosophila biarmipes]
MKYMETVQNRVVNNVEKTDLIISQLQKIQNSMSKSMPDVQSPYLDYINETTKLAHNSSALLKEQIVKLDRKVTDIDNKLEGLKVQIDNSLLQVEDFKGEASEKKHVTSPVNGMTKSLSYEAMTHISSELSDLRDSTDNIDKKLQFHINIVSKNIGRMMSMMDEIHFALYDSNEQFKTLNVTTLQPPTESNNLDVTTKKIRPIVSGKIDEVWEEVVNTKSTVDNLLPKSAALLTQTQRQEREIDEIHQDIKSKTNLIINNLDMVEKRLKKQENYVQILANLPEHHDLTTNKSFNQFVEYDSTNHSIFEETLKRANSSLSIFYTQPSIGTTILPTTGDNIQSQLHETSINTNATYHKGSVITGSKSATRKDGIIFPSIKNKPAVINTTIVNDILALKDFKGFSCLDILNAGMKESGVFYLQIRGTTYWFLKVYCDQHTTDGGWTVIQRRDDFGEPRENFNRDWSDYKNGFGEPNKDFWLGNENIYMLTNNEEYSLRVELEDFEGNKRYAQYSNFKIYSEADYYKLEIDGYEGNAGDSLNDPWYGSNNSPFSTYNKDNDRSSLNCASMLKGGWWWKSCGRGLNGLYLHDPQDLTARQGIVWFRWRGWDYTLKKSTMMIRPKIPQQQAVP